MADVFIVNPGQAVGQGDWEALAAQHGGVKTTSLRAATQAEMKAAGLGGDDDPAFQQRPIYRYYFNDGSFVEARTAANGADYQVVDYKPSQKFTQAQAQQARAEAPSAQKPDKVQVEGTPDPNAPGGFDNSRPVMASHWPDGRVTYEPLTPAERAQWEREKNGGKTDAELAEPAKPAQTVATNTTEPYIVTRQPDGTLKTDPNPNYKGPEQKPGTTLTVKGGDGKTYVVPIDAQGNPGQARDVGVPGDPGSGSRVQKRDKAGNVYFEVSTEKNGQKELHYENEKGERIPPPSDSPMAGLKGVPPFTPDLMQPGGGIIARQKQLDELLAAGKITWEQRQAVLANDVETAKSVAGEFNSAATLLRERYQADLQQRGQDMTQANVRANLANSHHQAAVGIIEKFAPYLGATAGDAGKLFVGMMASQLATATMYGGMKDVPRVEMDPRLRQFADRKIDAALGTATPPGPGQLPAPGATPPNAIGAGAVPDAITPTPSLASEVNAPVDPAQVRAEQAASGQPLPSPLLAPAPPAEVPYTPTPAVTQTDPLAAAPGGGNVPAMEAMFGKVLPEPKSWRQEAEERLYALRMPQVPGVSLPGIGASLPEQYAPAPSMDFSLPTPGAAPAAFGGDIDAEARRQLLAEGIMV